MLLELKRRLKYESELQHEISEYKAKLNEKYNEELRKRNKFNSNIGKYLPTSFSLVLSLNPPKCEIVYTQAISLINEIQEKDLKSDTIPSNLLYLENPKI